MNYYGTRTEFGCRFGLPHDLEKIGENPQQVWEKCKICGKTFRWNKGYKGRVANKKYLKAHIRQFAQAFGSTKRIFNKIHKSSKTIIKL